MPTKVKIDENLPRKACEVFLRAGIDAVDVHDQRLCGAVDPAIAAVCRVERRVLVTLGSDPSVEKVKDLASLQAAAKEIE